MWIENWVSGGELSTEKKEVNIFLNPEDFLNRIDALDLSQEISPVYLLEEDLDDNERRIITESDVEKEIDTKKSFLDNVDIRLLQKEFNLISAEQNNLDKLLADYIKLNKNDPTFVINNINKQNYIKALKERMKEALLNKIALILSKWVSWWENIYENENWNLFVRYTWELGTGYWMLLTREQFEFFKNFWINEFYIINAIARLKNWKTIQWSLPKFNETGEYSLGMTYIKTLINKIDLSEHFRVNHLAYKLVDEEEKVDLVATASSYKLDNNSNEVKILLWEIEKIVTQFKWSELELSAIRGQIKQSILDKFSNYWASMVDRFYKYMKIIEDENNNPHLFLRFSKSPSEHLMGPDKFEFLAKFWISQSEIFNAIKQKSKIIADEIKKD